MTRLRGEEQPGFLDILGNWLPHQPWFPVPRRGRRRLERVGGLRLPTPPGDPDARVFLELHLFELEDPQTPEVLCVPIALRSRPSALAGKSAFIGKLNSPEEGELWVYDGARDRAFLAAWLEMARRGQGSRNGRSRGEAYSGFDAWEPFTVGLSREMADPVFEDTTRTVVTPEGAGEEDWERRVAVDLFRRPNPERSAELERVLTLTEARATTTPRVLGLIDGSWVDRRESAHGTRIWSAGDLGIIREAAEQAPTAWTLAHTALQTGANFKKTARGLGRALGTHHADLAGAFGAHPQTSEQLKTMSANARAALAQQWEAVREEFDEDEAADLNEVIDMMMMQLRDAEEPLTLQQIHGNLGIEQLHQVSAERWVVADPQHIVEQALGLRDVVTALMSLANLVMEIAASNTPPPGDDLDESETEESEEQESQAPAPVNFGQWYEEVNTAFLEGYRESDADSAGVDSVFFRAAMLTEALDLFHRWKGQWVFRPSMLMQVDQ
ncbi:maltokinase N-terminal cap-like domain-containing protein [Nesterenkonia alba]|uniref:maltokinase N-terminal cap-like domain-containing protein n=1 Tax=Nesterenkonia alba TaxID=515814 RepID=UPI0003B69DB0|nr:hypothetical protein [Nesterenkonia alba]